MCLHLIAMLTIYVLHKFIRGAPNEKKTQTMLKSNDNIPMNNEKNAKIQETKNIDEINEEENVAATTKNNMEADDSSSSSSSYSSFHNSMNDVSNIDKAHLHHIRKTDTNYLLKDLISKEVNKIKDETDNLSNLLKEKIEAANIEGLIDKTVNGIVELKDDLMRMNEPEVYGPPSAESLRKRNISTIENFETVKGSLTGESSTSVDAFLKKEIDAIKKEVVIPAVLSNANSAK